MKSAPKTVVVGEGWAALGALARLLQDSREGSGGEIHWVSGSGGRVISPFASIESAEAATLLEELCAGLDLSLGERVEGSSFVREFRNRSFREPAWIKGVDLEEKRSIRSVELWAPETALVPVEEVRWELSLVEIEEQVRERLLGHSRIRRIAGVPVEGFKVDSGRIQGVVFGSGEELAADQVIYADRWSSLSRLTGLPKALSLMRGRDAMGVLQVIFNHSSAIRPEVQEGFFATLNRDSGDTQDRQVFGHFYREGHESIWTTAVTPEEGEDNHLVAKRLRKMKQSLEKMFANSEWAPGEFAATIKNEQVRFEEGVILASGDIPKLPIKIEKGAQAISGIQFVTDGYGVGPALASVWV
jgi:hypothetical protein